jgi:hypothetical protein
MRKKPRLGSPEWIANETRRVAAMYSDSSPPTTSTGGGRCRDCTFFDGPTYGWGRCTREDTDPLKKRSQTFADYFEYCFLKRR